jgi:hypothetical protein
LRLPVAAKYSIMKIDELKRIRSLAGLAEFTDPEGQFTTTAAPGDNQQPTKGFAVRVVGTFKPPTSTFAARDLWDALQTILPRDYPNADYQAQDRQDSLQRRILSTVAQRGSAIVKTGIPTLDMAETIAGKISAYRGKISPERPIPAEVIKLDQ